MSRDSNASAAKGKGKWSSGSSNGRGRGSDGSSSQARRQRRPFDVRFGQEEDANDICSLMNASYAVEVGDDGVAFRKSFSLSPDEVLKELDGVGKRWYLLETADDKEEMVACACFSLLKPEPDSPRTGVIHHFAVSPSVQKKGVGSHFLRQLERVFMGMGAGISKVAVAHHRVDLLSFLKNRGYKERGGESLDSPDLSRHTFMLSLAKDFTLDSNSGPLPAPPSISEDGAEAELMLNAAMAVLGSLPEDQAKSNDHENSSSMCQPISSKKEGGGLEALVSTLNDIDKAGGRSNTGTVLDNPGESEGLQSLEGLLGSLSQQLKTDEGRATFSKLSNYKFDGN